MKKQQKSEPTMYVLCLDPDSHRFYAYNLKTKTVFIPTDTPEDFALRAEEQLNILKQLVDFKSYRWRTSRNMECYRRRPLPQYCLKRCKYSQPCYVSESSLPKAINETQKIAIRLMFSEYPMVKIEGLDMEVLIVTAVGELLKNTFREIFQQAKTHLQPRDKNEFCFKHQGYDEFLYGQIPLVNFQCVRKALQEHKLILLELSQIEKEAISRLRYPPVYTATSKQCQVPWKMFEDSEFLMWYPPFPFNQQCLGLYADIKQINEGKFDPKRAGDKEPLIIKAHKESRFHEIKQKFKTCPRSKQNVLKRMAKRSKDIEQKVIYTSKNLIYSGECEFDFEFKVLGLDDMFSLFDLGEDFDTRDKSERINLATNNGSFQISYIAKLEQTKRRTPIRLHKKDTGTELPNRKFATLGPYGFKTNRNNGSPFFPYSIVVKSSLYHGSQLLCDWQTVPKAVTNKLRFSDVFRYSKTSTLSLESRLCFEIVAINQSGEWLVAGSGVLRLFDCHSMIRQGVVEVVLWPFYKIDPRVSCGTQDFSGDCARPLAKLFIGMPIHSAEVQWSLRKEQTIFRLQWDDKPPVRKQESKTSQSINMLQKLLKIDPLNSKRLNQEQSNLITSFRRDFRGVSSKFATLLDAVQWNNPDEVFYALQAKDYWNRLSPIDALPLLDATYADQAIRTYACQCINNFSDDELQFYMPQLIQGLTFQSQHYSTLGEVLLSRALLNPYVVGFSLYCQISAQLNIKMNFERLALILEQFIMLCGGFRRQLFKIHQTNLILQKLDHNAKSNPLDQCLQLFNKEVPKPFKLIIDPRLKFQCAVIEQCEIKDSKKKPLALVLKHWKSEQCSKFFLKSGDDLRQDSFSLQIMQFMNRIWLDSGISTELCFYKVRSIRDSLGIIEAIKAQTLNYIQSKDGKMGALKNNVILQYLKRGIEDELQFKEIQKNYFFSLAGSIVATYILGVGDRHSSNVMLTDKGQFVHIDYGNILGNFKQKLNVKRQISPFLFTEDIAFVLGGRKSSTYQQFSYLCGTLYNRVRRSADNILNLMMMMISAGMPQLTKLKHIEYCLNMLSLQLSQTEARAKIKNELIDSLNNETRRRFDNFAHNLNRRD